MTERELFEAALDREPHDRAAFLDRACAGTPEIRERLAALLARQEQASSFLEAAEAEPPADDFLPYGATPATEAAGQVLAGRYKLLEQIGEGGMGTVWLALQTEPVRRRVAVKLIKAGMDSRMVLSRFEAERQALAMMDHPNIAKVLDGGTTEQGRPFFVMEYVKGIPITQYCDDAHLTVAERLELLVPVCQAVQHAHQKGVIHRDLKPTNLLICLYDEKPVPKVIDFGLAKAMHQPLTEHTLYTAHGLMLGTPLYMSPEQAAVNNLDVDTRSDIYSLGVVLYELLTGTTPLEKAQLQQASWPEVLRMIKETEAPKPSTRLARVASGAGRVASNPRRSDSSRAAPLAPHGFQALDWIVMKALDKDRTRRYETANGLTRDLQRYLHDEPVEASPPSAWYRLRMLARRNRALLTTAALVSLALVLGTAVSVWQALAAQQALTQLGVEQQATQRELERTRAAEEKAMREVFDALVAQARANRLSRRIGQRFGTLEIVEKAMGIARQLQLPPERFLEMRNEAIAALALPDLRMAKEWSEAPVYRVHFDAEFQRYACTDRQGTVEVRRAGDGKAIHRLAGVGQGESDPMLSPDGSYLAVFESGRKWLHVWRLVAADPPLLLSMPVLGPPSFSPDSRQLAVQEPDGSIGVFDLAASTRVRQLPKVARVYHIAFHPSGARLALACYNFAQVRDLKTGEVLWQKDLADYSFRLVVWHPEGKTLALGDGQAISLWDISKDQQAGNLEVNSGAGTNFSFNPAGTLLASSGWDGVLRLWDPLTGRLLFSTHTGIRTPAPQFSADGRFLAATQHDNKLRIWEIDAANEYRTLVASPLKGKRPYGSVAVSPDGRFLAGGAEGAFALWDLPTGKELAFHEGASFNGVAFERGSQREGDADKQEATLLSMGANGLLRWPIRAEPLTAAVDFGPPEKVPCPTANCRIAQSDDGRVRAFPQRLQGPFVQDADQPHRCIKLKPVHQDVRHVAVSPDGRWVATGRFSHPGGVKIWERDKGPADSLTYKFVKDLPYGMSVPVFSPDGKRFVATAVGSIGPVRRWEVGTWAEIPFKEPIETTNAAFSPDGKLLVLETGRGIARIIDADTDKEYARLEDPDQQRTAHFAFTPDGAKLVCAMGEGCCVHIWDLQAIRRELAALRLNWVSP